jgi:hypothetical protein
MVKPRYFLFDLIQFLVLFSFQSQALASEVKKFEPCPTSLQFEAEPYFTRASFCDGQRNLRRVELYFPNTPGKMSQLWFFDGVDSILERNIFDINGVRTLHQEFRKLKPDLYHVIVKNPLNPSELINEEDRTISWSPFYKETLVRQWNYKNEKGVKKLSYIDDLVSPPGGDYPTRVIKRIVYSQEKFWREYHFKYAEGKAVDAVDSFTFQNEAGKKRGEFFAQENRSLEKIIQGQNLSYAEQNRRLEVLHNKFREPVVIIDTGFEYSHPDLTYLMYQNPFDPVDGLDNDRDGFIDNQFGWYFDDGQKISEPNNKERLYFSNLYLPEYPFSHGTHVASIAMKGNESFALVGFAGNYTVPDYLNKISRFISLHKVRFVNMSFGFGDEKSSFVDPVSRGAIYNLLRNNPQTLFHIAAGNDDGQDNDGADDLPATIDFPNTLIVAALDTDKVELDKLSTYKIADFSNVGIRMVDIAAPGTDIMGANFGADHVPCSGTSMASPYVLNASLAVASENPNLNGAQIKELLMKTAYIPSLENPMPVKSGGLLMRERAQNAARIMLQNPDLSVADAAWLAISRNHYAPESSSEEYQSALRKFWLDREVF